MWPNVCMLFAVSGWCSPDTSRNSMVWLLPWWSLWSCSTTSEGRILSCTWFGSPCVLCLQWLAVRVCRRSCMRKTGSVWRHWMKQGGWSLCLWREVTSASPKVTWRSILCLTWQAKHRWRPSSGGVFLICQVPLGTLRWGWWRVMVLCLIRHRRD